MDLKTEAGQYQEKKCDDEHIPEIMAGFSFLCDVLKKKKKGYFD